jgi:hypothetical protein
MKRIYNIILTDERLAGGDIKIHCEGWTMSDPYNHCHIMRLVYGNILSLTKGSARSMEIHSVLADLVESLDERQRALDGAAQ